MKYLFSLLALATITLIHAKEIRPELPDYTIESDALDQDISKRKSKFTFRVTASQRFAQRSIRYAVDDEEFVAELNDNNEFSFMTKPGEHSFMILLTTDFYEISTNTITIEPQHHMVIRLNFKSSTQQIMVKKPVIYLYPEVEMSVHVTIDPVGQLFFTYPHYNNGWDVVATPDGDLIVNGQSIDYLFWEAQMNLQVNAKHNSTVVSKLEAEAQITAVLDKFGLNSNEKADFLTYWIPEILQADKDNINIQFMFNDDCSTFGELNVTPAPNKIGRIYLLWNPTDDAISDNTSIEDIPTMDRSGFTVIEWGGAEIKQTESFAMNE